MTPFTNFIAYCEMAFTRCILFTRFTREQNTTCKGHLAFQKVIYSRESAIHSFSYPNIHSFYYECRKGTIIHLLDSLHQLSKLDKGARFEKRE